MDTYYNFACRHTQTYTRKEIEKGLQLCYSELLSSSLPRLTKSSALSTVLQKVKVTLETKWPHRYHVHTYLIPGMCSSLPSTDNFPCHFVSAFGAGFCATVVASPVDVVKTRYMNAPPGRYRSPLHCMLRMVAQEGPTAFYKG